MATVTVASHTFATTFAATARLTLFRSSTSPVLTLTSPACCALFANCGSAVSGADTVDGLDGELSSHAPTAKATVTAARPAVMRFRMDMGTHLIVVRWAGKL